MPREENLRAALAAVAQVRQTLRIESSNRSVDNKPEGFMVPLGEAKLALSDELFELQQRTEEVLSLRFQELEARLQRLRQLQIKLAETLAGNKEVRERFEKSFNETEQELIILKTAVKKPLQAMRVMATFGQAISGIQNQLYSAQGLARESLQTSTEQDVIITAVASAKTQRGNCDEMSSLAFLLLRDAGIKPIDLVETAPNAKDDKHQFVIIGRRSDEPLDEPDSWTEAVICDPWAENASSTEGLMVRLAGLGYPTTYLVERLRVA